MKKRKPEDVLSGRVVNLLTMEYPKIPYRVDIIADLPLPPWYRSKLKKIHGRWSKGYPDLFIMQCRGGFGGLFLELKATKTVVDSEHTRRQAWYHQQLRKMGYRVHFVCGYTEAKKAIRSYMKLKRNKI